jgi:hypothetical protein
MKSHHLSFQSPDARQLNPFGKTNLNTCVRTSQLRKSSIGHSRVIHHMPYTHVQSDFYLEGTHFEFALLTLLHGYVAVQFSSMNSRLTTCHDTWTVICHLSCWWCNLLRRNRSRTTYYSGHARVGCFSFLSVPGCDVSHKARSLLTTQTW